MLKKTFLVFALPLIFFLIAYFTLSDYGINWDEPYHYRRGQAFLQFLLTGQKNYNNLPNYPPLKGDSDNPDFRNGQQIFEASQKNSDPIATNNRRSFYQDDAWNGKFFINEENSYGHPPLNGVLAALFNKIFYQKLGLLGDLESYHLFIITIVSLATFFIAWFIWKEFGIVESIFSSLIFASYPLLLGEQHFNIKDPVETAFYTITIIGAYLAVKKNKFKWLLISIISFSLGLSTKFNIIFSVIPLSLWFIYFISKEHKRTDNLKLLKLLGIGLILTPIISIATLIISYPTIWKNPIGGILQILKFYHEVGYPTSTSNSSLYLGKFFNAFPVVWIIYTTPPIVLGLFVGSLVFLRNLIKRSSFVILLLVWLLVAIGRDSLFGALSYGGVRIIMEYVPALAMLTGITAGYIIKLHKNKYCFILSFLIILLSFTPTITKLIKIHPNENVYFNFLVGGLSGAKEKNIPYWGDSYGNAYFPGIIWLNQNAELNSKISIPVGNTSNIPRFKLRPDLAVSPYYWSGTKHDGEYLIEITYDYAPENYFALKYLNTVMTPVYEVKVDDVPIAKVWKNDEAHIRDEYKKTVDIPVVIKIDKTKNTLRLDLPETKKIMSVDIKEPTTACEPIKTGYVLSTKDNINWLREAEDIALDQQNRDEIKKVTPIYQFYFVARVAKTIIFNIDNSNACLLRATQASVKVLKP